MDNDELRIKIAELKGIKYDVYSFPDSGIALVYKNTNGDIPNWPVSIADAEELLNEMQSEPYLQAVQMTKEPAIADRWVIWVGAKIALSDDTLPRAICLAYIAYKESQK